MRKSKSLMFQVIAVALLFLSSCAGIKYDAVTVANAGRLDLQAKALVTKATTDSIKNSAAQIQALKDSFQVAISHEAGRGKTNIPTLNMWKAVNNFITTDFMNTWSKEGIMKPAFAGEMNNRIDKLFDYISNLETNKVK